MGKKFKKRKKDTAHRAPPLSRLDQAIYIGIIILFGILFLASLVGWDSLHKRIAFSDPAVIAYKGRFSNYAAAPMFLYILLLGIILLGVSFADKKPIFGNKTIRYGDYPWKTDIYPLFGPQSKAIVKKPHELKFRAALIRVLAGVFAATFLLSCFGIYGRTCLREDRTIVEYNALNRPGEPVSIARDCDRITIFAYKDVPYRGSVHYYYGVIVYRTDGQKYRFSRTAFKLGDSDCIRQMLAIKALFSPSQTTIEGEDLLPKVIEYNELDEVQTALLYQLFGPPQ